MTSLTSGKSQLDADLSVIADKIRRSTVQVHARGGHGSGLITSADGEIVTNAHVAGGRSVRIVLPDGRHMPAAVTARAASRDLAALRIDASGLEHAELRESRSLRAGELVIAVGNPLDLVGAVTAGIIHSADRGGRRVVADVRLLPGNSGGPLADARGQVVGVNAMVADGLAVAISGEVVRRFLAHPRFRPQVGIVTRPVAISVMGERRLGMLVLEIASDGAAARSGVLAGDVLIGIDGRLFSSTADLGYEIEDSDVGARIRFDIVRAGRVEDVDVIVDDAALDRSTAA